MPRTCPQCSQTNQDDTIFCRFCGYRFPGSEQATDNDATIRQPSLPANADPSTTLKTGDQLATVAQQPTPAAMTPQPQPQAANPGGPIYLPPVAPNPSQSQAPFMPPPGQQGTYSMQTPYYGAPAMAQAPGAGSSVLQRAFANKGTPVHHQSWLLDGKQAQPAILRNALIENIQRQGVMGVSATPERLREQGVVMEERDYARVQYGTCAVFVYMAPMGQNLYVSRTSTVQQPYSRIRIGVLIVLLIVMLISLLFFALINPSFDPTGNPGAFGFADTVKTFFGYAFFGLLFFFLYLLTRSIIFALTDKDFLAYLRPNRLNDFTLDALSSIERVTDKAVRETLRQAGLNANEITPPSQSYAPQQALHRL